MNQSTEVAGLKPCPFCGSEAYIQNDDGRYYAACTSLDCGCCYGEAYDRDAVPVHQFIEQAEAIAAWNTRAQPTLTEAPEPLVGQRLRDALQPFFECEISFADDLPDDFQVIIKEPGIRVINVGHLRRLRAALTTTEAEGKPADDCAHCGARGFDKIVHEKAADKLHPYRVVCKECGCGTAWHGDYKAAWAAWRRRAPVAALADGPIRLTMPNGDVLRCDYPDSPKWAASWTSRTPDGRSATQEQDWEIVETYGLTAILEAFRDHRIASQPSVEREKVETGWLIEHDEAPEWIKLGPCESVHEISWTRDSIEALRFARRCDAEEYVSAVFGDDDTFRITEHRWG